MANLLENLRKNDKKGLFKTSQKSVTYPTGFAPFDYRNGYVVEVRDDNDKLVTQYPAVGITGGTFLTVIGKTGTAKTTWCVQAAYNIVKKFEENAFVVHYDLEQALSYTRVKNITGASQKDLRNKYIIKQEKNYIEDIFDTIVAIGKEKDNNKSEYMYDTGLLDEFGDPIKVFVPTVIIIDSIPTLSSKDVSDEMEGSTLANRTAKSIAQFYKRLMPVIKTFNITVISVNHINAKIEINPFAKSQSQVMYLGQSESLPGGNAPIYYANNLIKFVSRDKFKEADDGFDGFMVRAEFLKSRSNKAGQSCNLIYNQKTGFDPVMSLYQFADDHNRIDGRNPYKYFKDYKDAKFDSRKFREAFNNNPDIQEALINTTKSDLEGLLSFSIENADIEEEVIDE